MNNDSLPVNIHLNAKAFEMSANPIHTAKDVCDKLISSEVSFDKFFRPNV